MRTLVGVLSAVAAMLGASIALAAPVADTAVSSIQTNGRVTAIAVVGSTAYIGGDFTAVRPAGKAAGKSTVARQHAAAVDLTTGALLPWNPAPDGNVRAIAATGTSVYLGGEFQNAGGASADHIAAVDPNTGKHLAAWTGSANDWVLALAVSGNVVYAGGKFSQASGGSHTRLAALERHHRQNGQRILGVGRQGGQDAHGGTGAKPAGGGRFADQAGRRRAHVGGLDRPGHRRAPAVGAELPVPGYQHHRHAQPRCTSPAAATAATSWRYDPATAAVSWRGGTDGNAQAIAVMNGVVYVGGHFTDYCGPSVGQSCARPPPRVRSCSRSMPPPGCSCRGPRTRLHAGRVRPGRRRHQPGGRRRLHACRTQPRSRDSPPSTNSW